MIQFYKRKCTVLPILSVVTEVSTYRQMKSVYKHVSTVESEIDEMLW